MRSIVRTSLALVIGLASLSVLQLPAHAGGAMVLVDVPDATTAALAPGADLIVNVTACGEATNLKVDARADGYVDGKRRSIALKLLPTSKPGVYGVARQWPAAGDWVLSFTPRRAFAPSAVLRVQTVLGGGTQLAGSARGGSVRIVSTRLVKSEACKKAVESELKQRT